MIRINQYINDYKSLDHERRNLLKRAGLYISKLIILGILLVITFSVPGVNYIVALVFIIEFASLRILFHDMEIKYHEEGDHK
jgi:hypothetical protein